VSSELPFKQVPNYLFSSADRLTEVRRQMPPLVTTNIWVHQIQLQYSNRPVLLCQQLKQLLITTKRLI